MTERRFSHASFFVQEFSDDQLKSFENAGRIQLLSTRRQDLQVAYNNFQQARAMDPAAAPVSDIRKVLEQVANSFGKGGAVLDTLLSREPAGMVALAQLSQTLAFAGLPVLSRKEISGLRTYMEQLSTATTKALQKLPQNSPGARSKKWAAEFLDAAQRVFEEANGPKKFKQPYMEAVSNAVGYSTKSAPIGFKRMVDKTRRRKRAQV